MHVKEKDIAELQKELHALEIQYKKERRFLYSFLFLVISIGTALIVINSPAARWEAWILIGIFGLLGLAIAFNIIPPPRGSGRYSTTYKRIEYLKAFIDGASNQSKKE